MTTNFTKFTPQKTSNQAAINRARETIQVLGKALPCRVVAVDSTGTIVTVAFELDTSPWTLPQITIPKAAQSQWDQSPTQIGDTGVTIAADTIISNISGLSSSLPNIQEKPANLASLMFLPVSNKSLPSPDPNAYCLSGPNGVRLEATGGSTPSSIITNQSGTTITFGSNTFVVNNSGIFFNGINLLTHVHEVTAIDAPTGGPESP